MSSADVKPKHAGGRPYGSTILNDEISHTIVEAMRRGNFLEDAAALAGVGRRTVYDWLEKGEKGEEPYAEFSARIAGAEAQAVDEALKNVRSATGGKLSSPHLNETWFLERRKPRSWGKSAIDVNHSGSVTTIQVAGSEVLTDAELRTRRGLPPEEE